MRLIIDLDGTICTEEKTFSRSLAKPKKDAVESIKITENISSSDDGTKSMQSITPTLGQGLGKINEKNSGKI